MESLADFDDDLLEQLLEDKEPAPDTLHEELRKGLQGDLIVPVLFGTAETNNGVTRLMKALRHEAPTHEQQRLAWQSKQHPVRPCSWSSRPSIFRIPARSAWRASGTAVCGSGVEVNAFQVWCAFRGSSEKLSQANAGDVVAFVRVDALQTGHLDRQAH